MADQANSDWTPMDSSDASVSTSKPVAQNKQRARQTSRAVITPYLEAAQLLVGALKGGDVLTYSSIVAGVDASVTTRRAQGQISLRYERRIANDNRLTDQNVLTGLARGAVALTQNVSLEAGGVASRTHLPGRGIARDSLSGSSDSVTQVYSVYAGPSFTAQAGEVNIQAAYRAGYTKVGEQSAVSLPLGQKRVDQFNDSISHVATASVSTVPGTLPFGWSVNGNWKREDASQLGSQFDSRAVRADVMWPVSPNVALVGGAGFEHIAIIERDVLRDASGRAILGSDGRLKSDQKSPRLEAFHNDGLIWDAGVLWRPGPRTSVEGRFGQRYGTNIYVGSLRYRPGRDWVIGVSAFDTVSGFGGQLNDSLSALPTQFRGTRNPLSGEIGACAFGQSGGICLNNILQNASSAAFRQRGVAASFSGSAGGWDSGVALGFNRRNFITAQLGGQAEINGLTDDSYFALAYLGKNIGQRTRFESNVYAGYFDSSSAGAVDALSTGANAVLYRQIIQGLSASAAVGLDSYNQEDFDSALTASALLGLRYNF